jgi:hypothetical protein
MDDLQDELNNKVNQISSGFQAAEMMSYAIWGAAVTTTRAFEKVSMKIDPNTHRIFVAITVRWWARYKKFKPLRDAWLRMAEKRCTEQLPENWKILVYYTDGEKGGST